jgi:peroxiredoxin
MRKVLLSLAIMGLVAAPALAGPGKFNKKVSVGEKAPDFSGLPAVANGQDTSVSLGDIKEDIVVVVFLANHCPVVKMYEDRVIDLVNSYKDKSVKVVGISVSSMAGDKLPGIKDYMAEHKSNYVYGYDESQEVGRAYGATNTPQFFVLDKERKIRYTGRLDDNRSEASVTKTYVKDAVNALLAGKEITETETKADGCGIQYSSKN